MQGDTRLEWQKRLGPLLWPAAWIYGLSQWLRRQAYRRGALATVRTDTPVVSVGSLVAGGAGKTPLVRYLARYFEAEKVAILSRGYGGSYAGHLRVQSTSTADLVGDEPLLLARSTAAEVWVGRNRAQLAASLADAYDLFILDDGFQHLALERFLNICVLPSEPPGRLLPAGLWRESPGALRAADLVVAVDGWPEWLNRFYDGPPIVITMQRGAWQNHAGPARPSQPVLAFCGIARPHRFLESLHDLDVRKRLAWPDHHLYTDTDLGSLYSQAEAAGAEALVTTAKDAVRLPVKTHLPLYWSDVEVHVTEGEARLRGALAEAKPRHLATPD